MQEPTMWGIHGGRTGDADGLFLKKNLIGLGWEELGDLSKLQATREAFKAAIFKSFPEMKLGAVPVAAGQLFRFLHEAQVNDLVVYPSQVDRLVHIGRIVAPYSYTPQVEPGYPNTRQVTWIKAVPRTEFSQGALAEIGAQLSWFQISDYADEFRAALEGTNIVAPVAEDEAVGKIAAEIEQTTRDFITKTLAQELKGHPFASFVAHVLGTMGFHTRVSPPGPDSGVDIVAHRDHLGFEPPIIKVQVKSTGGSIGSPEVQSLYGNISNGEHGLFVTLGTFTSQAKAFANGRTNLRLIDGTELVDLILSRYDQFDSRYKGILPLKRVYIPEPLKEG